MMNLRTLLLGVSSAALLCGIANAETLTIATVNNGDMIRIAGSSGLRLRKTCCAKRVTTDIATKGGQYDIMTIGTYEVPIWAKQSWLVPLDNLGADYDVDDLLPAIRSGLTGDDGKLYAAPFYGESSMVMYRKDLMEKAGLTIARRAHLGIHR
ncbi:bacterial extracellular solute-binding protein domain-containing protein [Ditylenchus destructor]|uniref:Bacterial extracellular solute-binding protein domain-containing protein n=1 Tax=Ditylenchus destructor TaxID=166010 RepID=A0AAD4QQZ0_9BILA|nr:bacterial extracellular solute-binding protein domain-containing protein [Ditylenchus destructor]